MASHGLPELLQPRFDEKHRAKAIFTGTQVQNDIRVINITNAYLLTE